MNQIIQRNQSLRRDVIHLTEDGQMTACGKEITGLPEWGLAPGKYDIVCQRCRAVVEKPPAPEKKKQRPHIYMGHLIE